MRRLDASSCINASRAIGLAGIRFDYVKLLYNAALKFDAALNVLVFPLDVGKRFARLIAHTLKRGIPLRPRLGVNRARYWRPRLRKAAMF